MLEHGRVDRPNQLKVVILQDNDYRRAFVGTPGTPTFCLCVSGSVADKALLAFLPGLRFQEERRFGVSARLAQIVQIVRSVRR